ncbi:Alpha/Beta hydrolase protein [Truncatella angustata]|uniref:Alpha/Beta hydrolase protein n=1 Tax=Truncatella angustata TaxID=152316 RepID=A0A9P8UTI6_9PEZI|nr:Alpha/Beta hydrolase protein [Truncatella angustata]KAH6658227.1 Alpha/Beta hydrolase protein [Truncatella angustata]
MRYLALVGWLLLPSIQAQAPPVAEQSTSFNSTFALTDSQISGANLTGEQAKAINTVVNFERSQHANGGVFEDEFYTLPPLINGTVPAAGAILKLQDFTPTESFALPPNTALSRFLYTTQNLNGTVIPASAFVLWPYTPRQFESETSTRDVHDNSTQKAPVVLWTHGTSGFFARAAPSTDRSLWYGHAAPFALAQAGYAVIAPDYAGLGISASWDGSEIPHQYLASPVSASDALYSLRAAFGAFGDKLDGRFAVLGHSQGGGVAWAVAEALESSAGFADLARAHVGTVAASPTTDVFTGVPSFIVPWLSLFLGGIFPSFRQDTWLTPLGIARAGLLKEIQGGIAVSTQLFFSLPAGELLQPGWNESYYAAAYGGLANAGGKKFRGPMLVLQGGDDMYVPYPTTTKTVEDTCERFSDSDLEYLVAPGVGHVPMLVGTMHTWLQWIQDRFEGKPLKKNGCVTNQVQSLLPHGQYQAAGNSFLQWAGATKYSYETSLGP